jgi:hypothetical protein
MGLDLGLDEPTTTTDVFPSSLRKPLPDIWHSCEIQGFDLEAFRRANNPQLALSAGRKETPTRAKMKIDTSDEVRACACPGIFLGRRFRSLRTHLAWFRCAALRL